MTILISAEKTFDKIQSVYDKTSQKTKIGRELSQPNKEYLQKSTANILCSSTAEWIKKYVISMQWNSIQQ